MAKYRTYFNELGILSTIHNRESGHFFPLSEWNDEYREYLEWVAEGNTPDPMYTPEEEALNVKLAEMAELNVALKKALVSQFEMILAIFEVGKVNGSWTGADFPQELRTKAASWKQKINRLKELES